MRTAKFSQISGIITNQEIHTDDLDALRQTKLDVVLA
jgi:hypothetical protein